MSAGEGDKPAEGAAPVVAPAPAAKVKAEPEVECPFCAGTGNGRSVDGRCNACYATPGRITASRIKEHEAHVRGLEAHREKRGRGRRW